MKVARTPHFLRNFSDLPTVVQKKFYKQLAYLLTDIRHPSLRAKKYDENAGIWQARVDNDFRFYFQIVDDTYLILSIIKHPK